MPQATAGPQETRAQPEADRKIEAIAQGIETLTRAVAELSDRSSRCHQIISRLTAMTGIPWSRQIYHPQGVHDTAEELIDCPECFPPLARALAKRPEKIREIEKIREVRSLSGTTA